MFPLVIKVKNVFNFICLFPQEGVVIMNFILVDVGQEICCQVLHFMHFYDWKDKWWIFFSFSKKETKPETYLNDLNKLLNLKIFFNSSKFANYTHLSYQFVILYKKMWGYHLKFEYRKITDYKSRFIILFFGNSLDSFQRRTNNTRNVFWS